MTNILHIDASARPGLGGIDAHGSYSRRLSDTFVSHWLSQQPDAQVRYRDVGRQPPAHIDHRWIEAAFGTERDAPWAAQVLSHSNELSDELLWADVLVLGVSIYNIGMPSSLKAWIDHIVRLGRTLHYTPDVKDHPFTGAFADRDVPVVVLSSRGDHGMDAGGPFAQMNHLEPAIGTALGFIGLREIHSIAVEHQSEGGEPLAQSLRRALAATTRLVDDLLRIQASTHSRSFA
ncbi:FMN-dependent NADH-azoreductase [Xanthomonas arboricola]|uniref:FMN-dependent NADH-azoreductase n=1 Tax=Xanthomonas arboricola TaxID=56448 RepID=UPI0016204C3A|nr:NAD(P)H-dependent oxidoreductase [Xanthomonas arboricola]MBB4596464.1 FMN-dependent NADH-azoreductase [Xanthomonas arboricola]